MKTSTIMKTGLAVAAGVGILSIGALAAATVLTLRTSAEDQHRERAAQRLNAAIWENPPVDPTIEQTKRLLLLCAVLHHDTVPETSEQMRFLQRWQAEIDRNGPEPARARAAACIADPAGTDPSPPIIQPMVATPQP